MVSEEHESDYSYRADWVFASCSCGWQEGPFCGMEDAADAHGDHRVHEATRP